MTPSNPSNNQPLIYRICDSLGVFHLVAPVDHAHAIGEVTGLAAALLSKADANHTHSQIKTSNASVSVNSDGQVVIDGSDIYISSYRDDEGDEASITPTNIANLIRALHDPDSAPTADSDNLVTSGGVKTALDGKANTSHTHTTSQITDFNTRAAQIVNQAIVGPHIGFVEAYQGNEFDLDSMSGEPNREVKFLLSDAKGGNTEHISDILVSQDNTVFWDNANRAIDPNNFYLVSVIFSTLNEDYPDGCFYVSVVAEY